MKKRITVLAALALTVTAAFQTVVPQMASAADYYGAPVTVAPAGVVSICNEHRVLSRIVSRFDYHDRNLIQQGLAIQDFSNIRLTRYEPKTERNLIERFYCEARANMNDNRSRPVWYLIETDMGYAGIIGDNVEYCVSGLDPIKAYGANCRTLR